MTQPIPAGRIHLTDHAPRAFGAMLRLEQAIELEGAVRELVKVRASQVNGCAFCLDMHWKEARADGETEERLYSLEAWAESPLYTRRERAALALCDAMTLVADGHVPDVVWNRARAAFAEPELAQLVFAIAAINAWNRLMTAARVEPGHYEPAAGPAYAHGHPASLAAPAN